MSNQEFEFVKVIAKLEESTNVTPDSRGSQSGAHPHQNHLRILME